MNALINRDFLRYCSYTHSVVYSVLLWAAISGRENLVAVLGWVHGIGWILMSLLCLEAVRRRVIPTWLGVMVNPSAPKDAATIMRGRPGPPPKRYPEEPEWQLRPR